MKKIVTAFVFLLLCTLPGCLTFHSVMFTIDFDPDYRIGTINIELTNIRSAPFSFTGEKMNKEQIDKEVDDDYNDLIKYLKGREFLLDGLEQGIYITHRSIYEKNGELWGSYQGWFRTLKFDNEMLRITVDSLYLRLEKDKDQIIGNTNAIIRETKNHWYLSWPKEKHIFWEMVYSDQPPARSQSLLHLFRNREKTNKISD